MSMISKNAVFGLVALASVLACIFSAYSASPSLELEPGKYAVTITYEVQDQRQNEPRTATRCITARDLDDPEKIFNDQTGAPPGSSEACSVRNLKTTNQGVSYDADCSNRTVHVQGHLSATGFLVVRTVKPKASARVSLKLTVRGTRTGDCSRGGKP
jgi:hypothetical protein